MDVAAAELMSTCVGVSRVGHAPQLLSVACYKTPTIKLARPPVVAVRSHAQKRQQSVKVVSREQFKIVHDADGEC